MNFLIIGTNFISDRFADAAKSVDSANIYAVFSRAEQTGRAFADRHGIERVYTTLDEALADENIDAVYVASPTFCHKEHSVLAMRAGKHVLCEKMLGADLADFEEMKKCASETGRVLLEAMRPAHDPAYDLVRSLMPRLGKIRRASLEFCQYSSRYDAFKSGTLTNAFNPALKNSALSDIGIYPLHAAIMLFGEPEHVSASSIFLHNGFEGEGMITLEYPESLVNINYSKISDSVNPSIIEGELGSLTINKISAPTELVLHLRAHAPERIPTLSHPNNMTYEISAFISMASGETDSRPFLENTEKAQKIVENIYKSSGISARFS